MRQHHILFQTWRNYCCRNARTFDYCSRCCETLEKIADLRVVGTLWKRCKSCLKTKTVNLKQNDRWKLPFEIKKMCHVCVKFVARVLTENKKFDSRRSTDFTGNKTLVLACLWLSMNESRVVKLQLFGVVCFDLKFVSNGQAVNFWFLRGSCWIVEYV